MSSSNILLAYGNKATGATLSGGQWESLLPLNNLKDGRLGKVARSSNASVYNTQFRFDLAANYVLRALALVNHNLTTGALWRARTTDATLDMDFTGPTSMRPRTLTTSGGANGTRVNIYGAIEAATCPRYDFSPVNLASGTATQTISNVPAGTYVLITTGSNAAVMATGSTVSNTGTIGTTTNPAFVVVNATGNVTLTVLSAATAIHFRESLGLLVEGAQTNLMLYSAAFDNAAWTASATVTANAAVSPDGSTTADRLVSADGSHFIYQDWTGTPAGAYTVSIYLRASTAQSVRILCQQLGGTGGNAAATCAVTTFWQRFSVTFATDGSGSSIRFALDAGGSPSFDVYAWGGQMENGSFPTTHIPTTSAAVTRSADSVAITGSNFSSWYNASEGSFYVDAVQGGVASGTYPGVITAYGAGDQFIALGQRSDDTWWAQAYNTSSLYTFDPVAGTGSKAALGYKVSSHAATAGGSSPSVSASSSAMPTVSSLRIGQDYSSNRFNGHIRRIAYWPTRRTNAELQAITTTGPDALGLDTGWQNALQMTFHGDTPTDWGAQYPLIAAFDAQTVRYGTIEIDDTANPDGYVELGQLFVAGGFQPEHNAEYQGYGDGRTDLSSSVKSVGGQKYSTARRRPRTVDFNFPVLEQDEGDHLDEMMAEVGTTEDVLYVPDPADPAKSQRYGFLGTLRELTPLEYPFFDHRAMPLRLEQKL